MVAVAACSNERAATTIKGHASGKLDLAIGADVRSFGLADATCTRATVAGKPILNVVVPAADQQHTGPKATRPDLLSARLPADLGKTQVTFGPDQPGFQAIASAVNEKYDENKYELIQVIAARAHDVSYNYRCTASRDGQTIALKCNKATVFPWISAGKVPGGSFRASVVCGE